MRLCPDWDGGGNVGTPETGSLGRFEELEGVPRYAVSLKMCTVVHEHRSSDPLVFDVLERLFISLGVVDGACGHRKTRGLQHDRAAGIN